MATRLPEHHESESERDSVLSEIQNRVLWLAMNMVHHANNIRPNVDGSKVGGHQSSSASVVTIMTYLYFEFMRAADRISVKPHASPVFHSIQYLLGNLDPEFLTTLREFHGLQAYPSRTKDPDGVHFSTGSVGLGPVAPNFAAVVGEYLQSHFPTDDDDLKGRYISLVGDAELDEGSIWEAIAEPSMSNLSNVLWIVDLNRQSLDRVIPGIRVRAWRDMFAANGWNVIDAKYGKRLQAAFALPNGELLRNCIDGMPNEVYQRLLRLPPDQLREWLPKSSRDPRDLARFISAWEDDELQSLFRNLGGHDFDMLRDAFGQADASEGPSVIFAYTLKGWMLPSVGDPQNHSVTLSEAQMNQLQQEIGIRDSEIWSRFDTDSVSGIACSEVGKRLQINGNSSLNSSKNAAIPTEFGRPFSGQMSTQQIFGLVLTDISRSEDDFVNRIVTVSPDVASSTNLGGWINKSGVWTTSEQEVLPDEEITRALKWEESASGQHIELGISENNLFMMLGQLGLSKEMHGELLYPIGTLYDPFVRRGLDAFVYSVYSGGKFVVVGTPSGVTLSPEGGAHQSMITQSIGIEMPDLAFYEPCFGQELEWILLDSLENVRLRERSTYLRLTSKRVDQTIFDLPDDVSEREQLRRKVLSGVYRLVDRSLESDYSPGENVVNLMASGAIVPEVVEASAKLLEEGIFVNVFNVTGAGPLYRRYQAHVRSAMQGEDKLSSFMSDVISSSERSVPVVTVVDGHPHGLAWIGTALNTRTLPLGVSEFGQSGSRADLYQEYGIDVESIMAACFGALEA